MFSTLDLLLSDRGINVLCRYVWERVVFEAGYVRDIMSDEYDHGSMSRGISGSLCIIYTLNRSVPLIHDYGASYVFLLTELT